MKAANEDTTVRAVVSMYRKMYGGIRSDEVRKWLRDTKCTQTGYERDTPSVLKSAAGDTNGTFLGHTHAGASELETNKTANAVSPRARVEPVRLDDDFGDLENDVISVIANDAAERRDGKIAPSVLDGLRQRLARARDRYGVDAFRGGLEIALDRGKGAAYAAGCMKRWSPTDEPQVRPACSRVTTTRPSLTRSTSKHDRPTARE